MGINKRSNSPHWQTILGMSTNSPDHNRDPFARNYTYTSSQIMKSEPYRSTLEADTMAVPNQIPVCDNQIVWKYESVPNVSAAVALDGSELEKSTDGECQVGDKAFELEVEMDMAVLQEQIKSLEEIILRLENQIQKLEEAIQEKPSKSTIIPLEGGIASNLSGCRVCRVEPGK